MALSYKIYLVGILHTPLRINVKKTSFKGNIFAHFMLYCRKQLVNYLIVEYLCNLSFFKYYVIYATLLVDADADALHRCRCDFFYGFKKRNCISLCISCK